MIPCTLACYICFCRSPFNNLNKQYWSIDCAFKWFTLSPTGQFTSEISPSGNISINNCNNIFCPKMCLLPVTRYQAAVKNYCFSHLFSAIVLRARWCGDNNQTTTGDFIANILVLRCSVFVSLCSGKFTYIMCVWCVPWEVNSFRKYICISGEQILEHFGIGRFKLAKNRFIWFSTRRWGMCCVKGGSVGRWCIIFVDMNVKSMFFLQNSGTSYREYLTKMWRISKIFVVKRMPISCGWIDTVRLMIVLQ